MEAVERQLKKLASDLTEAVASERAGLEGAVVEVHERTEQLASTMARLASTQTERNTEVSEALESIIAWMEIASSKIDRLERLRLPWWRRLWPWLPLTKGRRMKR